MAVWCRHRTATAVQTRWKSTVNNLQFTIRSLLAITTIAAISLVFVRRGFTIAESTLIVVGFPAFLLGPYFLIWGYFDGRAVLKHPRSLVLTTLSFCALMLFLPMGFAAVIWWIVNVPGYIIFTLVALSESRTLRHPTPNAR